MLYLRFESDSTFILNIYISFKLLWAGNTLTGTLTNSEDPGEIAHTTAFHQGSALFAKRHNYSMLRERNT